MHRPPSSLRYGSSANTDSIRRCPSPAIPCRLLCPRRARSRCRVGGRSPAVGAFASHRWPRASGTVGAAEAIRSDARALTGTPTHSCSSSPQAPEQSPCKSEGKRLGTCPAAGGGWQSNSKPRRTGREGMSCAMSDFKIILDSPSDQPALGFDQTALALKEIIEASKPQFVVGIFGSWGSGKTTLMRAIERKLNSSKSLTLQFSAWRYEKEPNLIIPLLDVVREGLILWAEQNKPAQQKALTTASTIG